MKLLDSGEEKVKKICEALRTKTLDPAKQEAKEIVDRALSEAEKIVKRAKQEATDLFEEANKKIQQEKKSAQAALKLSCKQTLEALKQELEESLFAKHLKGSLNKLLSNEETIGKCLDVILEGLKKEGLSGSLEVYISKHLSKEKVAASLVNSALLEHKDQSIKLSDHLSGVVVKVKDQEMTIELSDDVIKDLLAKYVREDIRELIFSSN